MLYFVPRTFPAMPTCWAPGCKSGYRTASDDAKVKRHFFHVPPHNVELWSRRIPRDGVLSVRNYICDIHFESRFILKTYKHVINGEVIETERGRWELMKDAEPTIFPNLPLYLSRNTSKPRQPKVRIATDEKVKTSSNELPCTSGEFFDIDMNSAHLNLPSHHVTPSGTSMCSNCKKCASHVTERYVTNRKIRRQNMRMKELKDKLREALIKIKKLKQQLMVYEDLPPQLNRVLSQAKRNTHAKSNTGIRYDPEWLLDSLLIRCKSKAAYRMLRDNGYLPLPSIGTLNVKIKALRPEFGFDTTLCAGLKKKLEGFPRNERRGVLMFDEIQITKNIDYRSETRTMIGMVDFGDLTTPEQRYQEGDHALVFLFQPHMSGWVQTIGCFCAAGTTPTTVLAKLILRAIILLENSGAEVDGLVCDGASTNRAALRSFGFCGEINKICNSMTNPCDDKRSIFFFCDTPHLLKTVRNNLLKAKEFLVPSGTVKMSDYRVLLQHDLNPTTGLRAVPKLTEMHIWPNNFQKMSVRIAAQLFSNSVAAGLELYKIHVPGLKDSDATIQFTRRINDLFDLLNGRLPKDGIRADSERDKLAELEEASLWLDNWERYINTLSEPKQKQFLSRQTCHGLRITLKSALDLTTTLLTQGFPYVLTGKFCQDPLEMFFGMIRQSCGGNDHPSPNQFLYAYRLLSISNLVKPGRRASVHSHPLNILLTIQSIKPQHELCPFVPQIEVLIDDLLLYESEESDAGQERTEHDYNKSQSTDAILCYLGGYVAHKLKKFTCCSDCVRTLSAPNSFSSATTLVEIKTKGGLQLPSTLLSRLIHLLEVCFTKFSATPNTNIYNDILNAALISPELAKCGIGCEVHMTSLTARCIHFYIATRLHFLKKSINRSRASRQKKHKLSKVSKLT